MIFYYLRLIYNRYILRILYFSHSIINYRLSFCGGTRETNLKPTENVFEPSQRNGKWNHNTTNLNSRILPSMYIFYSFNTV